MNIQRLVLLGQLKEAIHIKAPNMENHCRGLINSLIDLESETQDKSSIENKVACKEDIVSFCMRCFSNSTIPVDENTNFCHICGSEGTCIPMKSNDAAYLKVNIESRFETERKTKNG